MIVIKMFNLLGGMTTDVNRVCGEFLSFDELTKRTPDYNLIIFHSVKFLGVHSSEIVGCSPGIVDIKYE